jgi:anti-sigma factor RsiW
MNCREFAELLREYLFGDLAAEERAEFEKHLAGCPWCVASLEKDRDLGPLRQRPDFQKLLNELAKKSGL